MFTSIVGKYFQLEELEDKDSCTTELFLNYDRSVRVGETDGPKYDNATGKWDQLPDGSLRIILKRKYTAGKDKEEKTDIGEFQYEVERTFIGEITEVGGVAAVSGSMHDVDETLGDRNVGYFNLIDTTKQRPTGMYR